MLLFYFLTPMGDIVAARPALNPGAPKVFLERLLDFD
jgi:hypothetical protein